MSALSLGVLAGNTLQAGCLRQLVVALGHQLRVSLLAVETSAATLLAADPEVDGWLVSLPRELPVPAVLSQCLAQLQSPLIVDDGEGCVSSDPQVRQRWQQRMAGKLQSLPVAAAAVPEAVWVLAASTGGPEAVREFFAHLPADLPVAFVYVQHINQGYEQALVEMLQRYSDYPVAVATPGARLQRGSITVVASEQWLEWHESGIAQAIKAVWPGPYQPSINQLVANLGSRFGSRCGVIVFSGMGDDGAVAARLLAQRGGSVWVQSPQTCTIAAMPEAVLETGVVGECASPAGLASLLTARLKTLQKRGAGRGQDR